MRQTRSKSSSNLNADSLRALPQPKRRTVHKYLRPRCIPNSSPRPVSSQTLESKETIRAPPISPSRCLLYLCLYCPFESTEEVLYDRHRLGHSKLADHRCNYCSYSCQDAAKLLMHQAAHLRPQIGQRADSVGRPIELELPIAIRYLHPTDGSNDDAWRIQPDVNSNQCVDCGREFASETECAKHTLMHHCFKTQLEGLPRRLPGDEEEQQETTIEVVTLD